MPPKEFGRWVDCMVEERELTRKEVAALLGTTAMQLRCWESYESPPYIALAVSAIMSNLPPWREKGQPAPRVVRARKGSGRDKKAATDERPPWPPAAAAEADQDQTITRA